MGLLSSLGKAIQTFVDETNKPQSFKDGEAFENYVRRELFQEDWYDLVERTHDYKTNQDYVESSLKPDFKFRDKLAKKEFYVEVKFRSDLYQGKIVWCNDAQLARYNKWNKETPVFVLIGLGGTPKLPDELFLLPLREAKYTGLFPSFAEKFEIKPETPIPSKLLWMR